MARGENAGAARLRNVFPARIDYETRELASDIGHQICGSMPLSFITLAHLAMSVRMYSAN
jgi:hypothetical protein